MAKSQVAKVSASVVKPLTLTATQDLDLGTIILGPGTWSGSTVGISQSGVLTCGANLTCTGATLPASYTVTGTNNQVVRITAPDITMVNQSDATEKLTLVLSSPATVSIPNSGQKGVDFTVGGSITLSSATASGVYTGTLDVTVDY